MPHTKFITLLQQVITLDEADIAMIREYFEPMTAKKAELLVEEGKIAKYIYFVNTGFARVFHYQDGVEVTNHIIGENNFITSYHSFTAKAPSDEFVKTITACELLRITKNDLDFLYRQSHHFALFGIILSDKYLVYNNQRSKDLITLNAEQRYLKLMKDEPSIVQNVPLQYIASFLGIEPQTLSRIRRQIIS